ncbi:MAG: hypothetical protein RR177_03880, partial [Oscillospiraceae bacterium]
PDGDVWNTGHIEPPISGANVQSVGGNLELTKPSAADWPCVSLKFREPIQIDIQAAKYLKYDIESNTAFKVALCFVKGQMNTPEETWRRTDLVISRWISGEGNDMSPGTYKSEGTAVTTPTAWNLGGEAKIQLCAIRIWLVGKTADGSNCKLTIKNFGFGDKDLSNTDTAVNVSDARNYFTVDGREGNIKPEATATGMKSLCHADGGGYNGGSIQYKAAPIVANMNTATLDLSLNAYNGWNFTFFVRNPQTQKAVKFTTNELENYMRTGKYEIGVWGSNFNNNLNIDAKYQLMSWYKVLVANNKQGEFTVPADGIVEIYEIRINSDWVAVGKGTELRRAVFTNTKIGSNAIELKADKWFAADGRGNVGSPKNNGSSLKFTIDNKDGSSWINYQYAPVTIVNPIKADVSSAYIDLDLIADNCWNATALIRNPETGKIGKLDINKYLVIAEHGGNADAVIGDKVLPGSQYNAKSAVSLAKVIEVLKTPNALGEFTVPANGIVDLYEIRIFTEWVPAGQGAELKKFEINHDATNFDLKLLGSQIRVDQPATGYLQGLRFVSQLNITDNNKVISPVDGKVLIVNKCGSILAPTNYITNAETDLVIKPTIPQVRVVPASILYEKNVDNVKFTAVVIKIPESQIARQITTRAYAECTDAKGNETVLYSSNSWNRSVQDVVNKINSLDNK